MLKLKLSELRKAGFAFSGLQMMPTRILQGAVSPVLSPAPGRPTTKLLSASGGGLPPPSKGGDTSNPAAGGTVGAEKAPTASDIANEIAALPGPLTDHTWLVWSAAAARNGLTAIAALAGYPDPYQTSGNTIILDRGRGTPYLIAGLALSLSKCRGGAVKGNWSYGKQYVYFPRYLGTVGTPMASMGAKLAQQDVPIPFQPGETLTGYHDNVNTNEVGGLLVLMSYGYPTHRYPRSPGECMAFSGLQPRSVWHGEVDVTTAGAMTNGSGAAVLSAAMQETLALDADSLYYIVGARNIPGSADSNATFLQIKAQMGAAWAMRNAYIPLESADVAGTSDDGTWGCPFEPIGPFRGDSTPSISGLGVIAAALKMDLLLAKL